MPRNQHIQAYFDDFNSYNFAREKLEKIATTKGRKSAKKIFSPHKWQVVAIELIECATEDRPDEKSELKEGPHNGEHGGNCLRELMHND